MTSLNRAIAQAILDGDDTALDTALDKETLKYAIIRAITCPATGRVLDVRKSVYIELSRPGDNTRSQVMDGDFWDTRKDDLLAMCTAKGVTVKVIDGRVINAPKKRKPARQ